MGDQRVALILGASGDIGAAIAWALAKDGVKVALAGRDGERLEELARSIGNDSARAFAGDLQYEGEAAKLVQDTIAYFGRLDILVTAAAQFRQGTLVDLSPADWREGFAAMFFGAVQAVQAAWSELSVQRGHVILVSGVFAIRPAARSALPSAIAAALLNFAKSTAELGLKDGISVNCILPGPVAGRRLDEQLRRFASAKGLPPSEAALAYAAQLGIDRIGKPEDVGHAVRFLVSADAQQICGASLVIDGGITRAM
ncbi:MAG: short chain dehydrogenase [Sphingomonas bacterium]|nr:short chain dehydrogenase [Sphingomonas bacterium]